jgi:alginate O-acetyltransferase complex protein AlgI
MPFSSPTFLFVFLPSVLAAYWLVRSRRGRNLLLLVAGLFFYAWGEGPYIFLLVAAILANWGLGLWIVRSRAGRGHGVALAAAVVLNLLPLAVLKYGGFVTANANAILHVMGVSALHVSSWRLPAGISFFTFMALSYVIGVHRGDVEAQRDPLVVGLYISLFPLTMAGPICRYRDLAPQLPDHPTSRGAFAEGARRFVLGLAKKVLIANTLATPANAIFALGPRELSAPSAWLGLTCYTLQIFFDFAGYSDMAIGLGRMLGLRFMENFDYPYAARSLRAFWTKWHISLSTWFRDYVFLLIAYPASRALESVRFVRRRADLWAYASATLVTMLLIGLWHGASWLFAAWGLYHGVFLVLERTKPGKRLARLPLAFQHLYLMLVVMVGWVLFRSATVAQAGSFLAAMVGRGAAEEPHVLRHLSPDVLTALAAGALFSTPIVPALRSWAETRIRGLQEWPGVALNCAASAIEIAVVSVLLILSLSWISAGTFTPFIYFRF